jgi:hypothetical protein
MIVPRHTASKHRFMVLSPRTGRISTRGLSQQACRVKTGKLGGFVAMSDRIEFVHESAGHRERCSYPPRRLGGSRKQGRHECLPCLPVDLLHQAPFREIHTLTRGDSLHTPLSRPIEQQSQSRCEQQYNGGRLGHGSYDVQQNLLALGPHIAAGDIHARGSGSQAVNV